MISIEFASSAGRRLERTARMVGIIPLLVSLRSISYLFGEWVSQMEGMNVPGNNDYGDIILFTPEVKVLESRVEADIYSSAQSQPVSFYKRTVPE
jgi:hypothetical protein